MDHLTRRRFLAWSSGSAGTLALFGADIAPAAAQQAKDGMPATPLEVLVWGSGPRVVLVHVLRNTLIPLVTVLGLELGSTIAYAVVTETIFAWPGAGKLILDSINSLDRPVVVAYLMVVVVIFVTLNLVVDLLYKLLDPRVRLEGAR